jgi:Ca-activated chloride channel family protein
VVAAILFELLFPSATTTPQVNTPQDVALLIDTSGSMRDQGKIEEVKRAASDYVSKQPSTTRVAVVRFSSEAEIVSSLGSSVIDHLNAINSFRADGATNMADGISQAARALAGDSPGNRSQTILLFTDGEPGSNLESSDVAKPKTARVADGIRAGGIQIVAVGTNDADINFLAQLTGSRNLVFATTAGQFSEAFQKADTAIRGLFKSSGGSLLEVLGGGLARGALTALILAAALLIAENVLGLRGRWWRDLGWIPFVAAALGAGGALVGQLLFGLFGGGTIARAFGWALFGIAAGAMLGLADRSRSKASRGAVGGAIGGFLGGFVFDLLAQGLQGGLGEVLARVLGLGALGFAIGLMLQLAQQALKTAWLSGITTGPYEGKQYILGKPVVTVGRSDGNDIGLYREKTLALKAGAFAFNQGRWTYAGEPVEVNGSSTSSATLTGGDTIQFGKTQFLFEERGGNSSIPEPSTSSPAQPPEVSSSASSATPNPNLTDVYPIKQTSSQPIERPIKAPSAATGWQLIAPNQTIDLEIGKSLHLGRVAGNDIVLTDSSVSSKHALLEVRGEAVYLTDLGSTNGTSVNKHVIQTNTKIMLHPGDQVAFGASSFSLQKLS